MKQTVIIGTRPSPLALRQVREVAALLPQLELRLRCIVTRGDRDKLTPLTQEEGSDFFTAEIETALRLGAIDVAVHSAKDLEDPQPDDLSIAALTRSISPFDCLVSRGKKRLDQLAENALVGTSSRARQAAVLAYRTDLRVRSLRGTIEERIDQLERGDFDAIIVAHAALLRLGLQEKIAQIIPTSIVTPHPLQGRLALQVRKDREDLRALFGRIHDQ